MYFFIYVCRDFVRSLFLSFVIQFVLSVCSSFVRSYVISFGLYSYVMICLVGSFVCLVRSFFMQRFGYFVRAVVISLCISLVPYILVYVCLSLVRYVVMSLSRAFFRYCSVVFCLLSPCSIQLFSYLVIYVCVRAFFSLRRQLGISYVIPLVCMWCPQFVGSFVISLFRTYFLTVFLSLVRDVFRSLCLSHVFVVCSFFSAVGVSFVLQLVISLFHCFVRQFVISEFHYVLIP